ncbi:MAG: CopG family transcriptional regulator [Bryobacterales bacterium]
MRTTIDIPDELHRELKAKAALKGRTVRDWVVDLIREDLKPTRMGGKRVQLPLIKAKRKGVFNLTREEVDEAMFG